LIANRHLNVSTLLLTYVGTSQPHVVVVESNGSELVQIALAAVTAAEMVANDQEDAMRWLGCEGVRHADSDAGHRSRMGTGKQSRSSPLSGSAA
jgi:hypothetical protein